MLSTSVALIAHRVRAEHPDSPIVLAFGARGEGGTRRFLHVAYLFLQGRNVLGILPTGAGKSLCFQLPALILPGTVLVGSALIALMEDPPQHLIRARIAGATLDSTLSATEEYTQEGRVKQGVVDIALIKCSRPNTDRHSKIASASSSLMRLIAFHNRGTTSGLRIFVYNTHCRKWALLLFSR